jgi:hypothetical protein
MKKVIIINAVCPPEPMVSAQMGRNLADFLTQNGAQVTVLCPYPTCPLGGGVSAFSAKPRVRREVKTTGR